MSIKSKSRKRYGRAVEKAKRKAAQRAKYAAYRDQGINQKSKRVQLRRWRALSIKPKHVAADCGNSGCRKCSPPIFRTFLGLTGQPVGMPQWMWKLWKKRAA